MLPTDLWPRHQDCKCTQWIVLKGFMLNMCFRIKKCDHKIAPTYILHIWISFRMLFQILQSIKDREKWRINQNVIKSTIKNSMLPNLSFHHFQDFQCNQNVRVCQFTEAINAKMKYWTGSLHILKVFWLKYIINVKSLIALSICLHFAAHKP